MSTATFTFEKKTLKVGIVIGLETTKLKLNINEEMTVDTDQIICLFVITHNR